MNPKEIYDTLRGKIAPKLTFADANAMARDIERQVNALNAALEAAKAYEPQGLKIQTFTAFHRSNYINLMISLDLPHEG